MRHLITLFLFIPILANAQFHFGNGSNGNLTLNTTAFPNDYYAMTSVIATSATISGTVSFSAGDKFLLIQMEGSTAGKYSFHEVLSSSTSSGSTTIQVTTARLIDPTNFDLSGKAQLVTIPQYNDLTLQSYSQIFANNYNSSNGTGGIVCIMVANDLTFDGGSISVEGKGYNGGLGGSGGSGGTGGSGGIAGNSSNGYLGQEGGTIGTIVGSGVSGGGDGGASGSAGTGGALATNPSCPGCSVSATNQSNLSGTSVDDITSILMGGGGYGGKGGDGASGAGGGGGGASSTSGSGTNGTIGNAGGDGGDGSDGGAGGGIVFLFAKNILATSNGNYTSTWIYASGHNSISAGLSRNGQDGGDGGNGGNGIGSCSSDGPGGGGNGADGGSGGEGGSGGAGGPVIYLYSTTGVTNFSSFIASSGGNLSLGGNAGNAGNPGVNGLTNTASGCGPSSSGGSPGSTTICSSSDCLNYITSAGTTYQNIVVGQEDRYTTSAGIICTVIKQNATDSYVECKEVVGPITNYYYAYFINSLASTYSGDCINNYFNNLGATFNGNQLCCGSDCFSSSCSYRPQPTMGSSGSSGANGSSGSGGPNTSFTNSACEVTITSVSSSCLYDMFSGEILTSVSGGAVITGYNINGSPTGFGQYFMFPGTGTFVFQVDYTCNGTPQSVSGSFTVSDPCSSSSTPVELINFSGDLINAKVKLKWSTATEVNNDVFIIEKLNKDESWLSIGSVLGQGQSAQIVEYNFIDESPDYNINRYRLKQVDFDGDYQYSYIVEVKNSILSQIDVFPNPASDILHIKGTGIKNVMLLDVQGKTIKHFNNLQTLNLSDYSNGVYILSIETKDTQVYKKILKQ